MSFLMSKLTKGRGQTWNKVINDLRISWPCLDAKCPRIPTTDAILGVLSSDGAEDVDSDWPAPWVQKSLSPHMRTRAMIVFGKHDLKLTQSKNKLFQFLYYLIGVRQSTYLDVIFLRNSYLTIFFSYMTKK